MVKKKLLALGLIAVMALGQSGSVFAAEGTYYVSKLAYNSSYHMVTGSVTYTPTNSNSKNLSDQIELHCDISGSKEVYFKTTYGINATSTTLMDYTGYPEFGYNIGSVKNVNRYEEFGRTTTDF